MVRRDPAGMRLAETAKRYAAYLLVPPLATLVLGLNPLVRASPA
jgi:hypothetical protein